jgi:hypothetical protein
MTATQPPSPAKRRPPRNVDFADVDDIIGIAAEMSDLESERLSVEDLTQVASELDIPERHVAPAIVELKRRREALLAAEAKKAKRKTLIIIIAVSVLGLIFTWGVIAQSGLATLAAAANQARSQVVNVMERQRATDTQWKGLPPSPERSAELVGAENRVRIERKRYDEAAATYNASSTSFPNSIWAAIFGHPDRLPLSNELESF